MALTEESRQLMAMLAKSERDRRRANLAGDLYQASMLAAGQSPLQAQMQSDQLRQQEEGMDDETRWERSQALMKPLGDISEKKIAEYGKLLKDAGTAQRDALKKYLDTLRTVASARSGPAAARIRGEIDIVEAEIKQMDDALKRSETASRETNNIAKNIIKAASGETKEGGAQQGEDFGEVVAGKLDDILYRDAVAKSRNQPGVLSAGQRKHLVATLRPAMGQSVQKEIQIGDLKSSRDDFYQGYLEKDAGQDLEEIKQRRQLLIRDAPRRLSRHGVGGSGTIKKAEQALAAASDNYQNAIVKFRNEVPPESLFGSTVYEKQALPQLKAIQEAPSKALPSIHLGRKLMEREDVKEITGGDPTKLMDLMKNFQKSQVKAKRLPFFGKKKSKRPAPPSAVYGSERQVALEETEVPDGGSSELPGAIA